MKFFEASLLVLSALAATVEATTTKCTTTHKPTTTKCTTTKHTTTTKAKSTCCADNCLRAVRATAFPARKGVADCSSYLAKTVTPSAKTVFVTITSTTVPVAASSVTATSEVLVAATTILSEIETDVISVTASSTEFDTATSEYTDLITQTAPQLNRRAVPTSSKTPAYASACSGSARYSSACSCVGVTAKTITAARPTTTSTVYTTVTPSTSTFFTTAATIDLTSTSTTVTLTTTYTTVDVTSTVSTAFFTTTDATTTVTNVATVIVTSSPTPTFYLQANYPASDAANSNIFGYNAALNGQAYFIDFTPNLATAVQFQLDSSTGYVTAVTGPAESDLAFYSTTVGPSSFILVTTASFAASQGGQQLVCSIDASNNLSCNFGSQTAAFWLCGGHLNVVQPGYDFTNTCSQGTAEQISVSIIPIN